MDRNYKFFRLLKVLKIKYLKSNFDSIYAHTLIEYTVDTRWPKLALLFASPKVREAFKKNLYENENERMHKEIAMIMVQEFHTHKKTKYLRQGGVNITIDELQPEIKRFKEKYEYYTRKTASPYELKKYKEFRVILERDMKKSFAYQMEEYLKKLQADFRNKFLDGKLYIDLNAGPGIKKKEKKILDRSEKKREAEKTGLAKGQIEKKTDKIGGAHDSVLQKNADEYINQWLANDSLNLLVIFGEYGTGKTTFLQHMAHQLASNCLEPGSERAIADQRKRLPLLFPLREFERNMKPFLAGQFSNEDISDINFASLKKRIDNNELIIMLDGFDEMTQHIDADEKIKNFSEIRTLIESSSKSKIILTTRQEYFQSESDIQDVFQHRGKQNYRFIHLLPFSDDQIQQYLESHTKTPHFYWEQIQEIFELHNLARRPVLLKMITNHLLDMFKEKSEGETIINASKLYERCIEDELRRKSEKLNLLIPFKYRREILQKLAVWLFLKNTLSFDVRLVEQEMDIKQYFRTDTPWKFEKYLNEFLTFTFLISEGDNHYRISHSSFKDFLTARAFVQEINRNKIENFARERTTNEINQFIAEQQPNENVLIKLILNARKLQKEWRWQRTNAANILLKINPSALAEKSLSGCQLTYVDFTDSDLTGTRFDNADLSNCVFDKGILDAHLQDAKVENSDLFLSNSDLKNISFPNVFNGLSYLDLTWNQISDITPLKDLENLTHLDLGNNQITDITPLMALKKLTDLGLYKNQIKNFPEPKDLKKLTRLDLGKNRLIDITPLAELVNLTRLDLYCNPYIDIAPLEKLINLAHLDLNSNPYIDISPLKELINLAYLDLNRNPDIDISPLKELISLTHLDLGNNQLADISPLEKLINLTYLDLGNNQLSDIAALKNLNKLTHLHLYSNQIENISPLIALKNLTTLYLSFNHIKDISPFIALKNLTTLYLSFNHIKDISSLKQLTHLTHLDLSHNRVTDISSLIGLKNLIKLDLNDNEVLDISPLGKLKKLRELYLNRTKIKDFLPLKQLRNLRYLYLDGEAVSEEQEKALKKALPGLMIEH